MFSACSEDNFPIRNDLALAVNSILAFLIIATISYLHPAAGLAACAAALALAALWDVKIIWVLALFLIPFSQVFAFDARHMQLLVSVALIGSMLRCLPVILPDLRALPSLRSRYAWILLGFALLVILHFTALTAMEIIGAGCLVAMVVLFMMARKIPESSPRFLVLTECAIIGGALAAALLSAVFIYFPLPHLVINSPMPDNLRLNGVFDGPNAASRYLLPAFAFFLAQALLGKTRRVWSVAFLLLTALFLAATETKAAIGTVLLICLLAVLLAPPALRGRAAGLSLATLLCIFLWVSQIVLPVERHAGVQWAQLGDKYMTGYASEAPDSSDMPQILKRELRIGVSTEMTLDPKTGTVNYSKTSNSLWDTGQRDHVWRAGLAVIREHPLWGIGYKAWQQEMMRRLGYPFRGPHNGFMEVAGAYGILGAVLYLLLAAALARNLFKLRRCLRQSPQHPRMLWVSLAGVALFAAETVDVSTSLAVTLCAVWFWVFLGLQEGMLRQQAISPAA